MCTCQDLVEQDARQGAPLIASLSIVSFEYDIRGRKLKWE